MKNNNNNKTQAKKEEKENRKKEKRKEKSFALRFFLGVYNSKLVGCTTLNCQDYPYRPCCTNLSYHKKLMCM